MWKNTPRVRCFLWISLLQMFFYYANILPRERKNSKWQSKSFFIFWVITGHPEHKMLWATVVHVCFLFPGWLFNQMHKLYLMRQWGVIFVHVWTTVVLSNTTLLKDVKRRLRTIWDIGWINYYPPLPSRPPSPLPPKELSQADHVVTEAVNISTGCCVVLWSRLELESAQKHSVHKKIC